jgi:4-amino-4-deoxy-L-arabinose transferase-like glycosyltransferase
MKQGEFTGRNPWLWLGLGLIIILLRGLFIHVMDVDASQYASISMEMLQNGSWLQVQHRGADYLDKPPLLFWSGAFSFLLFGLSDWAYKLPSLLAALAGVYATYRFCLLYYPASMARNAAFMLASSVGFVLLCNDVRTDTLLLGMTTCSIWQFAAYLKEKKWLNFVGAFAFAGLAMLAKGPIGLVMPGFAVGTQLLLRRNWRDLLHPSWLLGLGIVLLILAPMCWGLYQQFDVHPEKTINDRTGVSGLYFFFWEQSFGRITGENIWKNNTPWYYFIHVYLWAFLPWCLLLWAALGQRIRQIWVEKLHLPAGDEAYSIGAFLITFVALSQSKYKLPHYIFITLPWAAVLVARMLEQSKERMLRRWMGVQYFVITVLLIGAILIPTFVFPTLNILVWGPFLVGIFGLMYRILRNPWPTDAVQLVQRNLFAMILVLGMLNFYFYPSLLPYQSTSTLMVQAKAAHLSKEKMAFFKRHGHALDFYNGALLKKMNSPQEIRQKALENQGIYLYTNAEGKSELDSSGVRYKQVFAFEHFQVALLKPAFLNPATRARTLEPVFLLKIPEN